MLVELRLENYAVVENLAVEFAAGLNLLTGETGAGKSILIDAIGLLMGEKGSRCDPLWRRARHNFRGIRGGQGIRKDSFPHSGGQRN